MLRQLTADNFYHVSTLNCLTATVHKYGAKIFAQLHHGRETPGRIATSISDGYTSAYGFDPFV